ncbi:unnamed protein product [Ixodes pacificus]
MQAFSRSCLDTSAQLLSRCFHATRVDLQRPWKILRLNHIAMATLELEKLTDFYKNTLGLKVSEPKPLQSHGVTTVFVEAGNTKFELLLPLGEKSPVQGFLDKNKSGGMHHICLEVDNIQAAVEDLRGKNVRTLSEKPSTGAHGKPVIFLHPKDCGGVLVELEEV